MLGNTHNSLVKDSNICVIDSNLDSVEIGDLSEIKKSVIGKNVKIGNKTKISNSIIAGDCVIGNECII